MIYEKFNAFIKEKYFANIGSHVVLSVDKQVIEEFCQDNSLLEQQLIDEFRQLFSDNWELALEPENFFGLIAIQIYVAHSMNKEEGYSKDMYNPRLSDFLKKEVNQTFYIELLYERYQDQIWLELKTWCIEMGYFMEIPNEGKYKGRYIQYPLSQALLNQDDLNRLPILFVKNDIRPINRSGFDEFSKVIKELDSKHKDILTPHYFRVKERLLNYHDRELLDLLYRQIFEYYCNWMGEIPEFELKQFSGSLNQQKLLSSKHVLTFEEPYFEIFDYFRDNLIEKIDIHTRELFQRIKKHYHLSHPDYIFFIKDDYGDWVETKYLEAGLKNLIILKRDLREEFLFKKIDSNYELTMFNYIKIIEIEIPKDYEPVDSLKKYLRERKKPFTIENGLKLDRKTWMYQAGPDIKFEKVIEVWIINSEAKNNIEKIHLNESMTISLRDYSSGKYVLVFPDYGRITIEIKSPTSNNDSDCKMGWVIANKPAKWKPVQDQYQISGLINTFMTDNLADSEIRDWIDANIGEGEKEQNSNNPLITNAIKRTKHGIRL